MARRDGRRHPGVKDWHLWAEVARTVSPLHTPKKALPSLEDVPLPLPEVPPPPRPQKVRPVPKLAPYSPPPQSRQQTEPGRVIEPKLKRKVVRGRIEIDGRIDLHGLRQNEARAALNRFIQARVARGDRTLLVITGKGVSQPDDFMPAERGVLRTMLPIWLSEPHLAPYIAGWDVAAQNHGGDGAFYVRVRHPGRGISL